VIPTAFEADLDSGRRMLAQTAPANRKKVLADFSREAIRWHTVKGMSKSDVVDALYALGVESGINSDELQDALADGIDNPFEPPLAILTPRERTTSEGRLHGKPELIVRRASDIEPQAVRWLWPKRLPIGKLTILAGEPGLGKSQFTCAVAAAVTNGGPLPCDEGSAPSGSVIILSAEDDAEDTIRPRLDAAGADTDRVMIVAAVQDRDGNGRRSFNLQGDLALLEKLVQRMGDVLLVIIDPVSSYLGKVDSHKNAELRAVLEPVGEMAARLGVAVLAVTHLNKSGGGSANNRFIGSIAFVAAARAAFIIARDPDDKDRRLMIPTKNNLGPEGQGLAFRIGLIDIGKGILAPMILWEGSVSVSAEEVLNSNSRKSDSPSRQSGAEDFLREILREGPLPTRQVQSEAKQAGMAWATVRRAKDTLAVVATKTALDGGWVWALPEQ
jgi:putative DNA primase/helicase